MPNKKYYVYLILTVTNKLYCGYTDDVERRYKLHCSGKGAKFTRANKPKELVYCAEFDKRILFLLDNNVIIIYTNARNV